MSDPAQRFGRGEVEKDDTIGKERHVSLQPGERAALGRGEETALVGEGREE